jgi:hypothetical protein
VPRSPYRSVLVLVASVLVLTVVGAPQPSLADDPATGETIVGELVQAYSEPGPAVPASRASGAEESEAAMLSWIRTGDETVRVSTEDVDHLEVGSTVRVTIGDEVADEASDEGMEPAHEVMAAQVVEAPAAEAPTAAATGPVNHQVTVVMMIPPGGAPDGRTVADVTAAINGPVATFWEQQTRGVVRLGVVATRDWAQATYGCDRPYDLWAEAAARAGWTYAEGRHLLVYLPYASSGCAYGLAEVRQSMGSGGQLYVTDTATSVIAHELGHNFGLNHSSLFQCASTTEQSPTTTSCATTGYRDMYDVMGGSWSQIGTLNALQANRLGVLPAAERVDLGAGSGTTTVTLQPLWTAGGTRAIRLLSSTGRTYWLEYRSAGGRDSWLGTGSGWPGLQAGVVLRRENPGSDSSLLLDATPSPPSGWAGDVSTALPVGTAVPVSGTEFAVTVLGTGATASVRVTSTGPALPWANWEALTVSDATVTLGGWAFDPDALSSATPVHLYIDGAGRALSANVSRPDVAAAFPAAGADHGFSWSGPLSPGTHSVCLYAIDSHQTWRNLALGCRSIDVQTALPVANWEALSAAGSTVTAVGWAFDADSGTSPIPVHAYVDGQGTALTANVSRPDVGAAFPGRGNDHGFSWSGTVAAGQHTVCLYAIDPQMTYRNVPLGCRSIAVQVTAPRANWEVVSSSGTTLSVGGWAFDPDATGTASQVHVYVDGQGTAVTANGSRPDVGAVFPGVGSSHGFSWSGTVAPGRHTVCVYAIDLDQSWRNTPLGCRALDVAVAAPRANWEVLSASGSSLTVSGWAFDPDSGTDPSQVHVYVDGQGVAVTANGSRPDVGSYFPAAGNDHGFSDTRTGLAAGAHTVCLYAVDNQIGWLNTPLGCRSITT